MTKTCTWKMSSAEIHLTFILHFGLWIRAVAALMLFWPLAKAGWARLQQQCISNCAAPIGVKRHSLRWTAMGSEKCTWPCPALSEVASLSCMPQFSAWHFSPVTILPHLACRESCRILGLLHAEHSTAKVLWLQTVEKQQ